jgi:hypothetical protein
LARAEKQQVAGRKYQESEAGKLKHKIRQERWRAKQDTAEIDRNSVAAAGKAPRAQPLLAATVAACVEISEDDPGNVTHQGDLKVEPEADLGCTGITDNDEASKKDRKPAPGALLDKQVPCSFCGRPCISAKDRREKRKGMHSFRRGPRLPVWSRFNLRI